MHGRHFQVNEARYEPKPDPPPPVMVGVFRPKMLRLTARHADWWNVSSPGPGAYRQMATEFERTCTEVGRELASVRRTWVGGCACASTQVEAEDLAGDRFNADSDDDFGFVGTPQQVVEQMRAFVEMGGDYFMLDCAGFPKLTTTELLVRAHNYQTGSDFLRKAGARRHRWRCCQACCLFSGVVQEAKSG